MKYNNEATDIFGIIYTPIAEYSKLHVYMYIVFTCTLHVKPNAEL